MKLRAIELSILLSTLLVWSCGDKPLPQQSASLASRIELAAGNVNVKQPGGQWEKALAGLLLRHGTQVKVGAGDRALIRMDDGSAVFMRHGTEVALEREGLKLAAGEVWIDAPPTDKEPARYRAGEVSVAAAGAGLDLRKAAGGEVSVYVARGLAVLSAPGGRTELQAGQRAAVRGKAAPKVSSVAFWEDWTGGMADRTLRAGSGGAGSGQIYAIDRQRPGSPPQELEIRAQHVKVVIRDGIARTIVDQRFFNPTSTPVEGYYWFTVPEGAAVDRFALEVSGSLIDGEVIERKQARAAYEASIRQAIDPALLEWVDGRTFRARIFPIPPAGERRVVLSYLEALPTVDNKIHYVYPMGGGSARVQEFALETDLGEAGESMKLATTADARIELGGKKVTMRRSGFKPQGDFLLEMIVKRSEPLRAFRVESSRNEAAYVGLRYVPDVEWSSVKKVPGHVVVVVDTSAGGDDADRQLRSDVAEAILRALSTSDKFALVAADLKPRVLYPATGLAAADEANVGQALEKLSGVARGGATDLGAVFDVALQRLYGGTQPAVVYIGDGLPTVGELKGDLLAGRVTRSMAGSPARLYTIAVGAGSNHALMERLARIGGGRSYRVDQSEQSVQEALRFVGSLKTPTITELKLDVGAGLDQAFSTAAGKVSRGQEVMVLARTHHPLPEQVKVTGKLGGKAFTKTYELKVRKGPKYAYVPKLWARRYLTHLLGTDQVASRGTIIRLGVDYALMTPYTSFLVLESDAAYGRFGIQRRQRDPLWGSVPHAALQLPAALGLGLFGCSRKDESPAEPEPTLAAREVSRAKSSGQYGMRGPGASGNTTPGTSMDKRGGLEGGRVGGGSGASRGHLAEAPMVRASPRAASRRVRGRHRPAKRSAKPADLDDEVSKADTSARTKDQEGEHVPRVVVLRVCSDAARRSLAQRQAIWRQRLDRHRNVLNWIRVYREAASSCELPHWRDRRGLLDLIQQRVSSPAEVRHLLTAVRDRKGQAFIRRRLLQRAVTAEMNAALAGNDSVNWALVEGTLAKPDEPQKRLTQLRALCQQHPASRGCLWRLIRALVTASRATEALTVALKMRTDGLATPELMQQIGDLLAAAGRPQRAMRVYSEIVEFSPEDPAARQLLGDIYLRHGWYEPAYRQYRTLTQRRPDDPLALMRLAAAAAGTGRVDEALRLERKVAGGQGEPGPKDPRRWARLWSAARIARLMLESATTKGKESLLQSMERSLRRLQVLTQPGVLVLVTWEDLNTPLAAELKAGDTPLPWAERVDASPTGLVAFTTTARQLPALTAELTRAETPDRKVSYQLTVIRWDGKRMRVVNTPGELTDAKPTRTAVNIP